MKNIFKTKISLMLPALMMILLFSGIAFYSCQEDDSEGGIPVVRYVRVTDPAKSDSLVSHAFMGNTIAIIGENLQDVVEIWFNDQSAWLNTALITGTSIIVTIPNVIPETVNNEMKLVTRNNKETIYPFGVDVPAPLLQSMLCEYVKDGDIAIIKGNFFIDDPGTRLKVFFPGNIEGEVKNVNINEIQVKVPTGVGVGPIVVKSIYGSTRSTFYFRDDRNIILDWDVLNASGGWRSGIIANSNPAPVKGNYVRFNGQVAGKSGATWNEDPLSFNLWGTANGRPNVPFYSGDLSNASLKFECYVVEPWKACALQMIFTPWSTSGTNSYIADSNVPRGLWIPWQETGSYQTNGWITVSFPLTNFKFTPTGGPCPNSLTREMLGGLTFFVWSGGVDGADSNVHMCIDNIRIVPL